MPASASALSSNLPGGAGRWFAAAVLHITGLFADHEQRSWNGPLAKYRLGRGVKEVAAASWPGRDPRGRSLNVGTGGRRFLDSRTRLFWSF